MDTLQAQKIIFNGFLEDWVTFSTTASYVSSWKFSNQWKAPACIPLPKGSKFQSTLIHCSWIIRAQVRQCKSRETKYNWHLWTFFLNMSARLNRILINQFCQQNRTAQELVLCNCQENVWDFLYSFLLLKTTEYFIFLITRHALGWKGLWWKFLNVERKQFKIEVRWRRKTIDHILMFLIAVKFWAIFGKKAIL